MSEQADAPEREDELQDQHQVDEGGDAGDTQEQDQGGDQANDEGEDQDRGGDAEDQDDNFEISFGDEAAPASQGSNSDLVRHLRAEVRKRDERIAAYERGEVQSAAPQVIDPGPKPTFEGCDYDGDKFETELLAWNERKRQADQVQAEAQSQQQAFQEGYRKKVEAFAAGKQALGAKDFELAESAVLATLSPEQQAAVIEAADDSAKVIYALGRHPEKLKTLAQIKHPIEFIKALVKLEGQLKVTQRRTPPDPDRPQRGSAAIADRTDKTLERLEKEAERTGDRTKVVKYRRQLKAQGKS